MRVQVVFVGNARDYHTIDNIRSICRFLPPYSWILLTDCIESEGHVALARPADSISRLFIIDPLLFRDQSVLGHQWRNLLKFLLSPFQAFILAAKIRAVRPRVVHAHTFYYGFICRLARIPFLLTPQGAELTERPYHSFFYRTLMRWTLLGASHVFVDSTRMYNSAVSLGCNKVSIIQYGIDTFACRTFAQSSLRFRILSIRGLESIYRIIDIQVARDSQLPTQALTFVYPLWEVHYRAIFRSLLKPFDHELGRVDKDRLYKVFGETILVVSIPTTDSSPRSVYEAIFCGCIVVTLYSSWIDELPHSMRSRIIISDLNSPSWLLDAFHLASHLIQHPFLPCQDALSKFDQYESAHRLVKVFYNI